MKTKLGNIFEGDSIVVSNSPHGVLQNGKAMDLVSYTSYHIIAPIDGVITGIYKNGTYDGGFHFIFGDYDILFHHCQVKRTGQFKKGQVIGTFLFKEGVPHVHTAIRVGGVWGLLLDYVDRNIKLLPEKGGKVTKWTNWSTYEGKYIILGNDTEMVYPQYPIRIRTLNTKPMALRAEPTTKSAAIAEIPTGFVWDSRRLASGELVTQNGRKSERWYGITIDNKPGWASACWIDEVRDEAGLIAENKLLTNKLNEINRISTI